VPTSLEIGSVHGARLSGCHLSMSPALLSPSERAKLGLQQLGYEE
jgi:hypothetical protein